MFVAESWLIWPSLKLLMDLVMISLPLLGMTCLRILLAGSSDFCAS